ncbi:hypothetical protein QYE76_071370 [Lolium multiflorum]|uniref:DUF4219 domain-containing protein n=1 Tax=Lolium multiflorum TaxID=4521 RepID=A0AAD8SM76_LOLMU|nr:hypothetical protein QYE76_071370 [Lolium multiflorum]
MRRSRWVRVVRETETRRERLERERATRQREKKSHNTTSHSAVSPPPLLAPLLFARCGLHLSNGTCASAAEGVELGGGLGHAEDQRAHAARQHRCATIGIRARDHGWDTSTAGAAPEGEDDRLQDAARITVAIRVQVASGAPRRTRSPSRGRSRTRRDLGGGEIVPQRQVVRETVSIGGGMSVSFPMLKRGEYMSWAMVMEVNLQVASLWDAVEDDDVPRHQDKQAPATLLRSTPSEMHCMLIGKGSAKAAWEAIRVHHQGMDRVRDTRVRRLRTEFETISFKDGERIDEFGMRITNLASSLHSLGDPCNDDKVVRKFLSVVPSQFVQIAFSVETLMDPAVGTPD